MAARLQPFFKSSQLGFEIEHIASHPDVSGPIRTDAIVHESLSHAAATDLSMIRSSGVV